MVEVSRLDGTVRGTSGSGSTGIGSRNDTSKGNFVHCKNERTAEKKEGEAKNEKDKNETLRGRIGSFCGKGTKTEKEDTGFLGCCMGTRT